MPADSERKLSKAHEIPAAALILDLEDAVADGRQGIARELTRGYLQEHVDRKRQQLWVRINPLNHDLFLNGLAAVLPGAPDGVVLPKVNAADDINRLAERLSAL